MRFIFELLIYICPICPVSSIF